MRKTAIVTGASRGIGRIIALRMAADGFGVVVNYAGKAEEVVNEITGAGGRALAIQADVANPEDVKQLFEKTIETFGQIDVVVNNAGIMPLSPIAKGDVETFDKVIATNLRGTLSRPLADGATRRRGRPHHRLLQQRTREVLPHIRALYSLQDRSRRPRSGAGERVARSQHQGERCGAWTNRDRFARWSDSSQHAMRGASSSGIVQISSANG